MTTIEFCEKRGRGEHSEGFDSMYDLGFLRNWQSVMGNNPLLWLLPVGSPPGDGINWPTRHSPYGNSRHCPPFRFPALKGSMASMSSGELSERDSVASTSTAATLRDLKHGKGKTRESMQDDSAEDTDHISPFNSESALPWQGTDETSCEIDGVDPVPCVDPVPLFWRSPAEFRDDLKEGCIALTGSALQVFTRVGECCRTNSFSLNFSERATTSRQSSSVSVKMHRIQDRKSSTKSLKTPTVTTSSFF